MKRIIAIFTIAAIMSLTLANIAFSAPAYAQDDYDEDVSIVSSLGIFENFPTNTTSLITRGAFAAYVTELLGVSAEYDKNRSPFYDVTSSDAYYNQIVLAAHMGIIHGDEDKNFRPDDKITYAEAIAMLLNGLKYNAEYPYGSVKIAGRLKITKNITADIDDVVNSGICARLLLNTGNANACEYIYTDTDKVRIDGDDTVFWGIHNISKVYGIVEANEFTSLDSDEGCREDEIVINGVNYVISNKALSYDSIGRSVQVYYKEKDNKKVVLYLSDYDTDVKTLSADDIESVNDTEIKYYNNEKVKTIYFDKTAAIIYNGVLTLKNTDERGNSIFTPTGGRLDFIDNDGDGVYEVVSVTSCVNMVVGTVDATRKIIGNYYVSEKSLDFGQAETDGNVWLLTDANGQKISPEVVTEYSVITYAKSMNDKVLRGIVSTKTDNGKVTLIKDKSDGKYMTIDAVEYKVDYDFLNSGADLPKVGDTVTVLLDCEKRIAGIKGKADNSAMYGFYIKAVVEDNVFEKKACAKIMNTIGQGGVQELTFADKVTIDGIKYSSTSVNYNIYKYLTVPDDYSRTKSYISKNNEEFLEPFQVILFKTDSDGNVTYIDTQRKTEYEDENTLTKVNMTRDYYYYSNGARQFYYPSATDYSVVALTDDSRFIVTPLMTDDDDYFAYRYINWGRMPINGVMNGQTQFEITAYTTDSKSPVPEVVHVPYGYKTTVDIASISALVYDIGESLTPEGDLAYKVSYYNDLKSYTYYSEPGLDMSDVKVGDIIKFEFNSSNRISTYKKQVEYDLENNTIAFTDSDLGTIYNHSSANQHFVGYNYFSDKKALSVMKTKGNAEFSQIDTFPIVESYVAAYVVSPGRNGNTVKNIPLSDMPNVLSYKNGYYNVPMFVRFASNFPRMIVFYESN